jgi:aspartate/methionine/tyrosine aminotransferase
MAVILAPYYFSHKLALQLCGAKVAVCPFDRSTLLPDWAVLQQIMTDERPKMVKIDYSAIPAFAYLSSMIN